MACHTLLEVMEGDQPRDQTDAQKPTKDPETEDAQSESSHSLAGLAPKSSTQTLVGLDDYIDDGEINYKLFTIIITVLTLDTYVCMYVQHLKLLSCHIDIELTRNINIK